MSPRDPRERFSETVDAYRRYRPDYPPALIDGLLEAAGWPRGARVADIGCGTGISSRMLAARGLEVIGIDPNQAMLDAAREAGGGIDYRRGEAEQLPLPDASVAGVTGAQAFHWFDLDRMLPELARVVVAGGWCAAFWNDRDESTPLFAGYEALLQKHCPEYREVQSFRAAMRKLRAHPALEPGPEYEAPHVQRLDRAGLIGRAYSASYVAHGLREPAAFDAGLSELFDREQRDGYVALEYRSFATLFRPLEQSAAAGSRT